MNPERENHWHQVNITALRLRVIGVLRLLSQVIVTICRRETRGRNAPFSSAFTFNVFQYLCS
jgi:hypothetical protein